LPPDVAGLQAEAARFGVRLVLPEVPPLGIWPENWAAVVTFERMQSQWRAGPRGLHGLDYAALPARARPGQCGRRGRRTFEALRVMEEEAIKYFNR
jgi:Phage related hypothetical protein (DUF1799)